MAQANFDRAPGPSAAVYERVRAHLAGRERSRRPDGRRRRLRTLGGIPLIALGAMLVCSSTQDLPTPDAPRTEETPAPRAKRARAPAPAAERPTDTAPEPTSGMQFYVRAGSFRDPGNALKLVELLRSSEPSVALESLPERLQAVMLGPYPDRALAEDAASRVDEAAGVDSQVLIREAAE